MGGSFVGGERRLSSNLKVPPKAFRPAGAQHLPHCHARDDLQQVKRGAANTLSLRSVCTAGSSRPHAGVLTSMEPLQRKQRARVQPYDLTTRSCADDTLPCIPKRAHDGVRSVDHLGQLKHLLIPQAGIQVEHGECRQEVGVGGRNVGNLHTHSVTRLCLCPHRSAGGNAGGIAEPGGALREGGRSAWRATLSAGADRRKRCCMRQAGRGYRT
mmetsp:Transcript_12183/g.31198  ORF Transcript_12183/g.31198 Transcript_12183/m.31198 type:complete len:213 (+) Transcript_12183:316-954(+)